MPKWVNKKCQTLEFSAFQKITYSDQYFEASQRLHEMLWKVILQSNVTINAGIIEILGVFVWNKSTSGMKKKLIKDFEIFKNYMFL